MRKLWEQLPMRRNGKAVSMFKKTTLSCNDGCIMALQYVSMVRIDQYAVVNAYQRII